MIHPDEELVAACRRGDESAWRELVERYGRLVYSVARRTGLDTDAAADVHQAVFVLAWRNLALLDRPQAIAGWLATIARREAWRAARRAAREKGLPPPLEEAAGGPDDDVARAERRFFLERGIEELDERCRRLLEALFLRRPPASYADVAAETGMPVGSLGPTRARCLARLRTILETIAPGVFSEA